MDKFISDTVVAKSGKFILVGNDAQIAFNCALEMNLKLQEFKKLSKERV